MGSPVNAGDASGLLRRIECEHVTHSQLGWYVGEWFGMVDDIAEDFGVADSDLNEGATDSFYDDVVFFGLEDDFTGFALCFSRFW